MHDVGNALVKKQTCRGIVTHVQRINSFCWGWQCSSEMVLHISMEVTWAAEVPLKHFSFVVNLVSRSTNATYLISSLLGQEKFLWALLDCQAGSVAAWHTRQLPCLACVKPRG